MEASAQCSRAELQCQADLVPVPAATDWPREFRQVASSLQPPVSSLVGGTGTSLRGKVRIT